MKKCNIAINLFVIVAIVLIVLPPQIIKAAVEISDGSVKALYHLEDTVDASGNGFNLTNNNSATFTTGKLANAVDGGNTNTNKFLRVVNDLGITGGNASIALWVKITGTIGSGFWTFTQQADNGNDVAYAIDYDGNGGGTPIINWCRRRLGVGNGCITESIALTVGTWYHLAITYDGTNVRAYRNNSLIGTVADSGNGSGAFVDGFTILADRDGANPTSGLIDETIVLSTALSTSTLTLLYNGGTGAEVCVSVGCGTPTSSPTSSTSTFMSTSTDAIVGNFFGYGSLIIEFLFIILVIILIVKLFTKWT